MDYDSRQGYDPFPKFGPEKPIDARTSDLVYAFAKVIEAYWPANAPDTEYPVSIEPRCMKVVTHEAVGTSYIAVRVS